MAAVATPMFALALCSCASAARISGRRRVSSEGRLTGISTGRAKLARSSGGGAHCSGVCPTRAVSRCCAWLRLFLSGGRVASVAASCARIARTFEYGTVPAFAWFSVIRELFFLKTDDLFGGFDLRPIGSPGDAGVDYIAHKSKIGRPGGLLLIVHLCGKVFHRAALPAEYVHNIGNRAV